MSDDDYEESYGPHDFSVSGEIYTDPMINQAMRGIEVDAIDFELEEAKQRTRDLARKNILIEGDIQSVEYEDKVRALKVRQDAIGWRKYMAHWFGM